MHVIVQGKPLVSPCAGIIYAAARLIYPIVGKFSYLMTDPDGKTHPQYGPVDLMFRGTSAQLCNELHRVTRAFGYAEWSVACPPELNPPEQLAEGKITVHFMIKPPAVCEYFSDRFTLGRLVDHEGQSFMTIEGHSSGISVLPTL